MATQVFKQSVWYWARRRSPISNGGDDTKASGISLTDLQDTPHEHSGSRLGVVVILGWMLSSPKHLLPYTRLYNSLGWDCLLCHPHVLNLFFPSMAASLASNVLFELVQDLEKRPCPVVFVSFSGGHKACLYKIIQILLGQCPETKDDKRIFTEVVRSVAGIIFDSGPMEFDSSIGAKVVSQQMLTFKQGKSIPLISHGAHALGRGLDIVFSKQLGLQRVDLWHALYSCVNMGPILVLCSDSDNLAPPETVRMFSSNLRKLGGQVDVVVWEGSKHVGHFRRHPEQYTLAVTKLLQESVARYAQQQEKSVEGTADTWGQKAHIWTNLPEHILVEISRMSQLSHAPSKERDHTRLEGSVDHSVSLQLPLEKWQFRTGKQHQEQVVGAQLACLYKRSIHGDILQRKDLYSRSSSKGLHNVQWQCTLAADNNPMVMWAKLPSFICIIPCVI